MANDITVINYSTSKDKIGNYNELPQEVKSEIDKADNIFVEGFRGLLGHKNKTAIWSAGGHWEKEKWLGEDKYEAIPQEKQKFIIETFGSKTIQWNSNDGIKVKSSIEELAYKLLKSGKNMEEVEKILAEDYAMPTDTKSDLGKKLAYVLLLNTNEKGRYDTTWGDKTEKGLELTVKRFIEDGLSGEEIAGILMLKTDGTGKYVTGWGNKTAIGLVETLKKIVGDTKVESTENIKANTMYRKENGEKVRVRETKDGRFQVYDRHDNYWYSADEDDFTLFPDDKEKVEGAKKTEPKLIIEQEKIDNNHKDSFWYDGVIATMGDYELVAVGEIRVRFKEDEEEFKDASAYQEAMDRGYTDKSIKKWEFDNNNWFEVIKKDDGSWGDPDASNYDEAIELLEYYATGQNKVESSKKVKADGEEEESMFPWGDYGDDEKFEEYWSGKHRVEVSEDFVEYFYAGDYKKAYDDLVRQMSDSEFKEAMEFIIRMNS